MPQRVVMRIACSPGAERIGSERQTSLQLGSCASDILVGITANHDFRQDFGKRFVVYLEIPGTLILRDALFL